MRLGVLVAGATIVGCASPVVARVPPLMAEIPVAPVRASVSAVPRPPPATTHVEPPPPPADVDGCPSGMVAIERFCVDRYEAPNVEGEIPFALQTAYDGEEWCAARGKHLCTEGEWMRACVGPHARSYPYGDAYEPHACNDDRPWIPVRWKDLGRWPQDTALAEATRLLQADMSGARAQCVSEEGVFDLSGNVAEWVRRAKPSGRAGYDHVLKGCFWSGCFKGNAPSCSFTNGAHPGTFRTYEAGFRCCTPRASGVASGR